MSMTQRLQHLALAGTLTVTGLLGSATMAFAQDEPQWEPDYYESMLTGYEIEISGRDFKIEDVVHQEYSDGENEQVYIESDYATSQVSFFDDSDEPADTIELWLSDLGDGMDSLEVVDQGVDGDVTWYYAEGVYEDLDFVYYVQIDQDVDGNVDMLESVLTLDGNLVDAVDASQQDITIDGDPFMDDVDLDDLEEFLDGGPFRGNDQESTPDSDTTRDRDTTRDQDTEDDSKQDSDTTRDRERLPVNNDDDSSDEEDSGNEASTAGRFGKRNDDIRAAVTGRGRATGADTRPLRVGSATGEPGR